MKEVSLPFNIYEQRGGRLKCENTPEEGVRSDKAEEALVCMNNG